MVRGKKTKGMVGLAVFLVTATVIGAPSTECFQPSLLSGFVASESGHYAFKCPIRLDVTGLLGDCLAGVMGEFHKLPVSFGGSTKGENLAQSLLFASWVFLLLLAGFLSILVAMDLGYSLAATSGTVQARRVGINLFQMSCWYTAERGNNRISPDAHGHQSNDKSEWSTSIQDCFVAEFSVFVPGSNSIDTQIRRLSRWRLFLNQSGVEYFEERLQGSRNAITSLLKWGVFETRCGDHNGEAPFCLIRAFVADGAARGPPRHGNLFHRFDGPQGL